MRFHSRKKLVVTIGLFATVGISAESGALADSLEQVIVTGTRVPGRTDITSAAPINVVSAQQLDESGYSDLGRALEALEPTINFPRAATTASSANTRAITLRGLSPDQVLVLVNGKRWHASSVLNFNNAVGRGTAPYDLGAIPINAIQRVEILRDGAAAQYGSDAIAGVVNIILKNNASGGSVEAGLGVTDEGDGFNADVSASKGFEFGDSGHLTASAQVRGQQATNRAGIDQQITPQRVAFEVGDPKANNIGAVVDASHAMGKSGEIYGTAIGSYRDSTSAAQYRKPGTSPLYPAGFVPHINAEISDGTLIMGWRDNSADVWHIDLSNALGYSHAAFSVEDTANTSLGSNSPNHFDGGTLSYLQDVTNLTVTRDLPYLFTGGAFTAGLESRYENYRIGRGEPASFQNSGAQGFPGLNPRLPVDASRNAFSSFLDLDVNATEWLTIATAGRFDHYNDFGNAFTWKTSLRIQAEQWLALRGSASTGFRAPSLQQQYFSSVTSNSNSGNIVNVGTFQVRDPVARALGATDLDAEKSDNYSLGLVLTPAESFVLTADYYRINVDDRIALSDQLSGSAVTAALAAAGIQNVQNAQFFTNAADTTTKGFEITAVYKTAIADDTPFNATLGYGRFKTTVRSLAVNPVLPTLPLLGSRALLLLTEGQPVNKLNANFTLSHQTVSTSLSITRYGEYTGAPVSVVQEFSPKNVVDFSVSNNFTERLSATIGVLNIGNVYPDKLSDVNAQSLGLLYGEESPFGVNGRAYYLKCTVRM